MTTLRLAWRNLRRNRRRTALTSSALCFGLIILVLSIATLDGTDQQSINNLVKYDVAHVKAFAPGYLDEELPNLENTIANADSILNILSSENQVMAACARLEMSGVAIYRGEETFTRIIGLDPEIDRTVFETLAAVTEGESLSDNTPLALIGDRMSKDMGAGVGDHITLLMRSAPGAINTRTLLVTGILSTGHPKVDQFAVYIPLKVARELALLPGGATEIAVRTDGLENSQQVSVQLAQIMPAQDWRDWKYLARDFMQFARMKRTGQSIIISIFVIMAAVGIANTMVIAIHERIREIGTLRAMGFRPNQVGRIFIFEGLLIGAIAGSIALIIGASIVSYLSVHGISLARYEDMDIGYPVRDAIYPVLSFGTLFFAFAFGIIVSVVASWSSARRAARGEVVKALREGML